MKENKTDIILAAVESIGFADKEEIITLAGVRVGYAYSLNGIGLRIYKDENAPEEDLYRLYFNFKNQRKSSTVKLAGLDSSQYEFSKKIANAFKECLTQL